jgi:hypothetical protein
MVWAPPGGAELNLAASFWCPTSASPICSTARSRYVPMNSATCAAPDHRASEYMAAMRRHKMLEYLGTSRRQTKPMRLKGTAQQEMFGGTVRSRRPIRWMDSLERLPGFRSALLSKDCKQLRCFRSCGMGPRFGVGDGNDFHCCFQEIFRWRVYMPHTSRLCHGIACQYVEMLVRAWGVSSLPRHVCWHLPHSQIGSWLICGG